MKYLLIATLLWMPSITRAQTMTSEQALFEITKRLGLPQNKSASLHGTDPKTRLACSVLLIVDSRFRYLTIKTATDPRQENPLYFSFGNGISFKGATSNNIQLKRAYFPDPERSYYDVQILSLSRKSSIRIGNTIMVSIYNDSDSAGIKASESCEVKI